MERSVFLIVGSEEYFLGTVKEIIASRHQHALARVVRDIVEDMVFSDDGSDYTVCSIEVR